MQSQQNLFAKKVCAQKPLSDFLEEKCDADLTILTAYFLLLGDLNVVISLVQKIHQKLERESKILAEDILDPKMREELVSLVVESYLSSLSSQEKENLFLKANFQPSEKEILAKPSDLLFQAFSDPAKKEIVLDILKLRVTRAVAKFNIAKTTSRRFAAPKDYFSKNPKPDFKSLAAGNGRDRDDDESPF